MNPELRKQITNFGKRIRKVLAREIADEDYIYAADLMGACAVASTALHRVLRNRGHNSILVVGREEPIGERGRAHCWVELGEYIIDITATQFQIKHPVYIVKKDKYSFARDYTYQVIGRKAYEELKKWGMQSPFRYKRIIERIVEGKL